MCDNTKKFLHNSAISVCGFVLVNAVTQLVTHSTHSMFGEQIAAGVALLALSGGLIFVGYAVTRPLESRWQTAISLTVVPILTILAAACIVSTIIRNPYPLVLLAFSAELYFALIPEAAYSGNDTFFYIFAPFVPFLCISIGAALRARLEEGEM